MKAQQPVPPKVLSGEQATNLLVEELAKSASISVEDARRATNQAKPILDFIRAHESDPAFGDVWADYTGGQYSVHLRLTDAADPTGLQSALTRSLGSAVQRHVGGAQHLGVQAAVSSAIQLTGDALLDRQTAATVVYDQVAGEARSTTDDKVLQGALKAIKNVRVVPEAAITAEPTSYGTTLTTHHRTSGSHLSTTLHSAGTSVNPSDASDGSPARVRTSLSQALGP